MSLGFDLANPGLLWLLLLVLPVAGLGWWRGVARGRLQPAALVLRVATLALVIGALAQPLLASGGGAASTVIVLDRSRSLPEAESGAATSWVRDALAGASERDRAAVIAFGASPRVAAPAGSARALDSAWAEPDVLPTDDLDYTDIASALALARALPLGGARRIVLLSDGAENTGSALDQAIEAAADGVPIDVLPLAGVGDDDLRIDGASAPEAVWSGEPVTLLASVHAPTAGRGQVGIWVDGVQQAEQEVDLPAGLSSHAFELPALAPGFHAVDVRVAGDPAFDRIPGNDTLPLALTVRGQPRLLLIVPPGGDPGKLEGALARGGAEVTVVPPEEVPSRLSALGRYDGFVLDNVPAAEFSLDQLAGLQEAARGLGKGLVVVGGTASYGPGGYAGTVLEDTLPVTVKVTDGRQRQRVALLLIMDKSGSMSYDPLGGEGKIELAKEAVHLAARSLAEGDQIGVLVFNDRQEWIVPLTTIGNDASRAEIDALIEGIDADGGTEILPALSVGLDAIRNVEADARHVVLLSDGKSRTGTRESYQTLLDDVLGDRTTLSTIAIGEDADTDLLNFLADLGGGRYHFTDRPEEIPRVTLEEAQSAGSQSIIRGNFAPIQTEPSPILAGFDPASLPALDGYDFAEAKPDAQVILTSDRDDPVLAKWQYGLGRVVAWTADNGTDLAAAWRVWPRYDEFWAAMVRWALPDPENRPLRVTIGREGPEAVVSVETAGDAPTTALGALTGTIVTPSGATVADRPFVQTGPGTYQLRIVAPEPGAYQLDLRQGDGPDAVTEATGFAILPSPELRPAPGGSDLLRTVADRTGGRVLNLDDPGAAFSAAGLTGETLREYRPIWYVPLTVALALFLLEIALRMGAFAPLRARFSGRA